MVSAWFSKERKGVVLESDGRVVDDASSSRRAEPASCHLLISFSEKEIVSGKWWTMVAGSIRARGSLSRRSSGTWVILSGLRNRRRAVFPGGVLPLHSPVTKAIGPMPFSTNDPVVMVLIVWTPSTALQLNP